MNNYFDCIDEEESWLLPLTPSVPLATQDSQSLLPNTARSPENLSRAPSPPMYSLSPPGPSEDTPPQPGENLALSAPTTSGLIQGKCLLLTWSQVQPTFSKELIRDHLSTLGELDSLAVGQETHADGGIHFHACVMYRKKIGRRPTAFAILGRTADVRVANAKIGTYAQSIQNMWTYAQKEDPNPLLIGKGPSPPKKSKKETYREALALAATGNLKEAMDHLATHEPVDYTQKGDSLLRNLTCHRDKRQRTETLTYPLSDFVNAPEIPDNWCCLYLWGPTDMGKSQFAKALLPGAKVIRHTDQLKDCDFTKGVIFDDFNVKMWPPTSVIHLLDWDEPSGIHCRYAHVDIPPHTRKIFTFNTPLDDWCPQSTSKEQFAAIERRIICIQIHSILF